MYLIHHAHRHDLDPLRAQRQLWRRVRRYNLPVQLAVAAAEQAATRAADPATLAIVSLAPCRTGSPELFQAVSALAVREGAPDQADLSPAAMPRLNPIVTLHAVDNLALSALAIGFGNHAYGLGLGGAPGQAWSALEIARERLADRRESEVLVVAGEQDRPGGDRGRAVALLFAAEPPSCQGDGVATPRLLGIDREPMPRATLDTDIDPDIFADAAAGLVHMLDVLATVGTGELSYQVPPAHGDGLDQVTIRWQLT